MITVSYGPLEWQNVFGEPIASRLIIIRLLQVILPLRENVDTEIIFIRKHGRLEKRKITRFQPSI